MITDPVGQESEQWDVHPDNLGKIIFPVPRRATKKGDSVYVLRARAFKRDGERPWDPPQIIS